MEFKSYRTWENIWHMPTYLLCYHAVHYLNHSLLGTKRNSSMLNYLYIATCVVVGIPDSILHETNVLLKQGCFQYTSYTFRGVPTCSRMTPPTGCKDKRCKGVTSCYTFTPCRGMTGCHSGRHP